MKRVILVLAVFLIAALTFGYEYCAVPSATPTEPGTWVSFNPGPATGQTDLLFTILPQIAIRIPPAFDYGELCIENPEDFNGQKFYIDIKKNCPITIDAVMTFWMFKDGQWNLVTSLDPYFVLLLVGRTSHIWTGNAWTVGSFYPMTEGLPFWYGVNCYDTFWFKLSFTYDYVVCRDWCLTFIAAEYKATIVFTITGELDP
ncbi:hypothetical protein [Kosmotoga pacifica]|uniref:Uncharacterized protein n=1 Tax=Kosmotoga pacifica TaxID=1330330 RepID=A0A0G2Z7D6_9BACT|nr:hypothetical protein [Kosmotoga pacifica]AKI97505.1 hypothetical protein IX53_06380 [Kosmotoga pacifica]